MESCIYPFERFERLKKWKGYSLAYSFGYSFKLLQNEMFDCLFIWLFILCYLSNKREYLFYLVFIGFIIL